MSPEAGSLRILGIDTTSRHGSIAISIRGKVIDHAQFMSRRELSKHLLPELKALLKRAKIDSDGIDVCGVSVGPGLFTGIRVGIATVKGLFFNSGIPVVPLSTLAVIASSDPDAGTPLAALIDAGRGEWYVGVYRRSAQTVEPLLHPRLCRDRHLKRLLMDYNPTCLISEPGERLEEMIREHFPNTPLTHPSKTVAEQICLLTEAEFTSGRFITDLKQLNPEYVRRPDAEGNRPKQ